MKIASTLIKLSTSAFLIAGLASCSNISSNSGHGIIMTNTIEPVAVNNGVASTKRGQACSTNILGLVTAGDTSIEAAMRNGHITKVATVNVEKSGFMVYGHACTVVRGE